MSLELWIGQGEHFFVDTSFGIGSQVQVGQAFQDPLHCFDTQSVKTSGKTSFAPVRSVSPFQAIDQQHPAMRASRPASVVVSLNQ
jgi:hypothetical protein